MTGISAALFSAARVFFSILLGACLLLNPAKFYQHCTSVKITRLRRSSDRFHIYGWLTKNEVPCVDSFRVIPSTGLQTKNRYTDKWPLMGDAMNLSVDQYKA